LLLCFQAIFPVKRGKQPLATAVLALIFLVAPSVLPLCRSPWFDPALIASSIGLKTTFDRKRKQIIQSHSKIRSVDRNPLEKAGG